MSILVYWYVGTLVCVDERSIRRSINIGISTSIEVSTMHGVSSGNTSIHMGTDISLLMI